MAKRKKGDFEPEDVLKLTELEQVRVLADPLRLRIVERLCEEEATTKQVAQALGEKPTKLYHHVEALERIGLIRQTRTRRNRGTLERYYRSVALRFEADGRLFQSADSPPKLEALKSVIDTIVTTTSRELNELAGLGIDDPAEAGVLSFVHIEAGEKTIARLKRRLLKLCSDIQALQPDDDPTQRKFRMTIAFYPIDHDKLVKPDKPRDDDEGGA